MRAQEFVTEYRTPKPVLTNGQANYNGIVIKYNANRREQTLDIQALSPQGKVLGFVNFFTGPGGYSVPLRTYRDLEAEDLQVDEKYRGQGIAQTMYDFVKSQGYKIYRSDDQTDAGSAFWDKNRGSAEVWESFNQPYPIKWEKSEHGDYDALAQLGDGTYLSIMFNNEGDDEYQIEFHRNNSQAVTGEGDAQRVFATVLNAIQQFLKVEQPWRFIFSASKDVEPGQNSQSRAKLYNRLIQRYAGSWGYDVYHEDHGDQITYELTQKKITEISDERLQDYLSRAGKRVDSRLERMARARQRLDKGYEIYHAEDPARVVHKFEANTPADAQRYYQDYIERYESDVDYDLRLRRSTGLTESTTFAQMPAQQIAKVAQDSFAQLYPGVKLYGASTVEGVGLSTQKGGAGSASAFAGGDTVRGEFYITLNAYAEGNEMIVVIEDATAGQYKGAATAIIKSLFAAGERLYKTQSRELVINNNSNYDAWSTIASRVGAEMVSENFADGKKPGRKGLAKRMGVNCKQSVSKLRKIAKNSSGERARMAHWCANMKAGKKNES